MTFSSEEPVERWFGDEILDHSKGAVRLARIRDHGPLLKDHDRRQQTGVIESVEVRDDRRGHTKVRFGNSDLAAAEFKDVLDDIRVNVSVGYVVHEMVLESEKNGYPTYRATDWEPYEISIVSIPADITVGIGREQQQYKRSLREMTVEEKKPPEETRQASKVNVAQIQEEARQAELTRVSAILELGKKHDLGKTADEYIRDGKTVEEMAETVLKKYETKPLESTNIGLSPKETERYSIVRAINSQFPNSGVDAGLEREASRAIADKLKRQPQGIFIPAEIQNQTRDLNVGTDTAGGYTVATDLLTGSFIEILKTALLVESLGATVIDGLVGDIDIPKQTGSATGYWLAEGADLAESDQTVGQLSLTPRTVGAMTDYSRKLLNQSSISVENFVRQDLAFVLAKSIDKAALYGTGGDQPTGINTTNGINTLVWATGDKPTWAEIVELESLVDADEALTGNLSYLSHPTMKGTLKTSKKDAGSGIFIWDKNEVNGYSAHSTTQVVADHIFFGNWKSIIIALWGILDILVDPYTKSKSGGVRITAFKDADVGLRHAESFAVGSNL